jgi:4'-phosphopantetheinyl transferase
MAAVVEIWDASLGVAPDELDGMLDVLSPAELDRAARLRTPELRRRFVAAHAFVRDVLGRSLGIPPESILLGAGAQGKPRLAARHATELEFSLSHSADRALCAVTTGTAVGVDIERVDPAVECEAVAVTCFSARERSELLALPADRRLEAFFATWTRKEACVKALGTGLSTPLGGFSVPVDAHASGAVAFHGPHAPAGPWTLLDVRAPAGFAAALAVRAPRVRVRSRSWALSERAPAAA